MLSIETARLRLRNFCPADAPDLREMILQYGASDYGRYDQPWPTSEAEIRGVVDWFASGDQFLAVCLKETGQFAGLLSLAPTGEPGEYNLGYIFNAHFHGQGYALEGCQALIAHAFSERQAAQIVSGTAALNAPSCRLLARLGFQQTGEESVHFQSAPDGTPYEFLGYTFRLARPGGAPAVSAE